MYARIAVAIFFSWKFALGHLVSQCVVLPPTQTRGRRGAGSFIPAALQHHHEDRGCKLFQNSTCRGRAHRQLDPGQVRSGRGIDVLSCVFVLSCPVERGEAPWLPTSLSSCLIPWIIHGYGRRLSGGLELYHILLKDHPTFAKNSPRTYVLLLLRH